MQFVRLLCGNTEAPFGPLWSYESTVSHLTISREQEDQADYICH